LSRDVTTKSVRSVPRCERAAKPQLGQRHVAAAGVDKRRRIGVGLVPSRLAKHQHADVAGAECHSRTLIRWQILRNRSSLSGRAPEREQWQLTK
jgi:hypothetical protein